MIETAWRLLNEQDSFAAIDFLSGGSDPPAIMQAYTDLVRRCYWQHKEPDSMILFARAGIQAGLGMAAAVWADDEELARRLRGQAKALAYDLASFTWPGWGEPGIHLTPTHMWFGMDAARANLRLARELNAGDLALARACWMLGAHHLAADDRDLAQSHFEEAEYHASLADALPEVLLARAFNCLAVAVGRIDPAAEQEIEDIKTQLAGLDHGLNFVEQIDTARRVFADA